MWLPSYFDLFNTAVSFPLFMLQVVWTPPWGITLPSSGLQTPWSTFKLYLLVPEQRILVHENCKTTPGGIRTSLLQSPSVVNKPPGKFWNAQSSVCNYRLSNNTVVSQTACVTYLHIKSIHGIHCIYTDTPYQSIALPVSIIFLCPVADRPSRTTLANETAYLLLG